MRQPDDWRGATALAIAVLVAGGWAAALIIVALPSTGPISQESAGLLASLGGVLAGGVVMWLGGRQGPPGG